MTKPTIIALSIFGLLSLVTAIIISRSTSSELQGLEETPPAEDPILALHTSTTTEKLPSLPILASAMPAFQGITKWWNTADGQPLTPDKLKGKVVLVDFWTYSCINCIRTYPFLKTMYERYADKGLVIIGVHTPEFAFEAEPENVGREIEKNGLKYAVALDPQYKTWNAYQNRYWPAEYLFDQQSRLRRTHFGEGEYEQNEMAIRSLLEEGSMALQPMGQVVSAPDLSNIETEETYFGLRRGSAFMGNPGTEGQELVYHGAKTPEPDTNRWALDGTWKFEQEYVEADSTNGIFRINVQANALHIVMESADGKDKTIEISVDGVVTERMKINASTLYTIATFPHDGRHTVQVKVLDPGVRFYAATFS